MKCPNCGGKIDEFTEVCPHCKINLDEYENNQDDNTKDSDNKTILLKIINWIQLIICIIVAIMCFSNNQVTSAIIYILVGIISFAFIKGFYNIIDLLDSINEKLNK